MRDVLLVFTNPLGEEHDRFNDWYTNVHIRDVMRMPTSIAVQRFRQGEEQLDPSLTSPFAYLAMYEVDDTVKCTKAHAVSMTPALPISDTFDLTSPASYYRVRSFTTADPLAPREGALIVIQFDGEFDAARAAMLAGRHGVLSVTHVEACGDRLIDRDPVSSHLVLLRLSDPVAAVRAWPELQVASGITAASLYHPVIGRLTADKVANASPEDQQREDRSRAALENAQHRLVFKDGAVQPA